MLFRTRKPGWIGPVDQVVKIHYRKLPINPIYNARVLAHWALQIGDYVYEIAEPAIAPLARDKALQARDEIIRKAQQGDEDYDEEEIFENLLSECFDEDLASGEDDGFMKDDDPPFKLPGENFWDVPLLISKAHQWSVSKKNKGAGSFLAGKTRLRHEKIRERAIHIFEKVFKKGYDILYDNCQAFVCYLYLSISLLDPPKAYWNSRILKKPSFEHRHFFASYHCYCVWKTVIGEFPRIQIGPDWKVWKMLEKDIEYNKMISPRRMKELLEPEARLPKPREPRHASHHHEPPKSHAAHSGAQAHHMSKHDQTTMLNAITVQLPTIQQQVQPMNYNPNPTSFLPMPGVF